MRYSTEPTFRKSVKRYGFSPFPRKFGDNNGKKIVDTATTASKRVVQKTAEATGDLIGNEITDKTTSISKSKNDDKTKKVEEFTFH